MSAELAERIRRRRVIEVPVGKFVFLARRPTDVEYFALRDLQENVHHLAMNFVTGWKNVTEDDIVGGAGMDEPKFSDDAWHEWCADRRDFWVPIGRAVIDAYMAHRDQMEAAEKK